MMAVSCVSPSRMPKIFCYDEKHRQQHEAMHGLAVNKAFNPQVASQKDDNMYNYQVSLVEYGMIVENFYDTVSEGGGR